MTANNHQSREEPIDGLSLRARREARLAPGGEGAVFRSYAAMSLMLAALIVWDHWLIIGLPVIGVLLVALVTGMWFRLSRRMRAAMKRANSTSTQPNQERTEEQQDQHDHGSQDGSKEEGTVEEAAPYRVDREQARDQVVSVARAIGIAPPPIVIDPSQSIDVGAEAHLSFLGYYIALPDSIESRDALEWLIAHELGHVLKRDPVVNMALLAVGVGLAFALGVNIYTSARALFSPPTNAWLPLAQDVGVVPFFTSLLGSICGAVAAFSLLFVYVRCLHHLRRRQEYAADAVAIRHCRHNQGLHAMIAAAVRQGRNPMSRPPPKRATRTRATRNAWRAARPIYALSRRIVQESVLT